MNRSPFFARSETIRLPALFFQARWEKAPAFESYSRPHVDGRLSGDKSVGEAPPISRSMISARAAPR